MSVAAAFGSAPRARQRWLASLAVALALHAAGTVFLLQWRSREPARPPTAAPSVTVIDLQPLPTPAPPTPTMQPPPKPPPQPVETSPQVPTPLPKPIPPKHTLPHKPTPTPPQTVTTPSEATTSAPPMPQAPAAPTAPVVDHAVPRFTDLIAAQLERYKRYPSTAQKRGEQGTALLRFTLDRGGNVSNARIERSAGHADLDDEVLALLRRAAPLPPIPANISANTLDVVVPVSFALR